MTQRNQAGQDAGAGEVFVECIEKARLPDFEFSRHGEIGAWLSQRRLPKQKMALRRSNSYRYNLGRWIARKAVSTEVPRVYTRMTLGSQNGNPGLLVFKQILPVFSNRDHRTLLAKIILLLDSLCIAEHCYFVADAYSASGNIDPGLLALGNHLVTRFE